MPRKKTTTKTKSVVGELKALMPQIQDATEPKHLASFTAFPEKITFDTQSPEEKIVLFLRQHPIVLLPKIALALLIFVLPLIVIPIVKATGYDIGFSQMSFGLGLAVLWAMIIISICATSFFMWYFTVSIVTTERIVDINFDKIYTHDVSECLLEKIEDVSHKPAGMWAAIFDYGNVYIQTAAEQREFEFLNVPRPRDVQDTILDLLEWKDGDDK